MYQGTQEKAIDTRKWQRKFEQKFEPRPQYLIPLLQYVQSEEGFLPPEAMLAVAEFLRIPHSKVFGVASFYAQFHFTPRGRNIITVCRGTACHVRGSGPLLRDMERELGIAAGETTADLAFSLETVACFGSCALAPVVVVNSRVSGRVTSNMARQLVEVTAAADRGPKKPAPRKTAKPAAKKAAKPAARKTAKPAAKRAARR